MAQTLYLMSFLDDGKHRSPNAINFEDDLHLTLVPNFTVPNRQFAEFRKMLSQLIPWFFPLEIKVTHHTTLGKIKEVNVAVVESAHPAFTLMQMHLSFLALIRQHGGKINDVYSGLKYTPHITYLKSNGKIVLPGVDLIEHTEGFGKGIRTIPKL